MVCTGVVWELQLLDNSRLKNVWQAPLPGSAVFSLQIPQYVL
jgi:hypothetical protein